MFYYLNGTVSEMLNQLAVIDCGGVGFAVNTSANTLSRLKIGESAKLYTYCNVREDAFDIYGFYTAAEKHCFELLIGVSGVGPKAALSILSSSSPEALVMSIISENEKALTVAPGVGKRLAQRIILELKDKMGKESEGLGSDTPAQFSGAAVGSSKLADAAAALSVLGYGGGEINAALSDIDIDANPLEEIIRQALKKMVK